MMVVADLDELFIPIPDELLVNLSDSREVVEMLLETLPTIHQNARSAETALGPAIRVAFKLMVRTDFCITWRVSRSGIDLENVCVFVVVDRW